MKTQLLLRIGALLLLIGAFGAFSPWKDEVSERIQRALNQYEAFRPEKIYVHFDKPYYTSGEVLWFKTYLVNALTHEADAYSRVAYVELVSPSDSVFATRSIKIENGQGLGDFILPASMPGGEYRLRAFTRYMLEFGEGLHFEQPVYIWDRQTPIPEVAAEETLTPVPPPAPAAAPPPDVQFFPEGGDLVEGLPSRVAIWAVDFKANGIALAGRVVDNEGAAVVEWTTDENGFGDFVLTPEPRKKYFAVVSGKNFSVPLPEALPQGHVMQVSNQPGEPVIIVVTGNEGADERLLLVGHTRSQRVVSQYISLDNDKRRWQGMIRKDSLHDGILTLTLFSQRGLPLAERLVFVENPLLATRMEISVDKASYGQREPVHLRIQLGDSQNRALPANLSVVVTNQSLVARAPYAQDIRSYLLLNSDLRGYIENPNYYFVDNDPERKRQLDLLMMTQGWRRFVWRDQLSDEPPAPYYPPEQGFTLAGRVTELDNEQAPVQTFLWLNAFESDQIQNVRMVTDEAGRFRFLDLDIRDTSEIILQARIPRRADARNLSSVPEQPRGNRDVSIWLAPLDRPAAAIPTILSAPFIPQPAVAKRYREESLTIYNIERAYGGISILLDEIVVRAERPRPRTYERPGMLYGRPDTRIPADSLIEKFPGMSVLDLLRFSPGVQVMGVAPYQRVIIRGQSGVLYLLDGIPVDVSTINSINPWDVEFIDVIRGPNAAVYGMRGGAGAVAVYTKMGTRPEPERLERGPGIVNFTHSGYYRARKFFQPTYDKPRPEHRRPDHRTTLYWNPEVRIAEDGRIGMILYTDDNYGQYDVIVEGISHDGRPVVGRHVFNVDAVGMR